MRVFALLVFCSLFSLAAQAGTRVFEMSFEGKTYYALILNPVREAPFRIGVSKIFSLRSDHELGTALVDLRKMDPSYAALEFLFKSGKGVGFNNDLVKMSADLQQRLREEKFHELAAHIVEEHLFKALENWSIGQYLKRKRFDQRLEVQIRAEFERIKDGYGWIAILDENKNIVGTLATATRTTLANRLPIESRLDFDIPELPATPVDSYAIIGHANRPTRGAIPALTAELKRFVVDRKSPLYLLPVLLYFGEKSGMTWQGPITRFQKTYAGRPFSRQDVYVGQYVIECDAKAAEVYQKPPFSFGAPDVRGDDFIFTLSRYQFLQMFTNSLDIETGKISGLTFFESVDVKTKVHANPDYSRNQFLAFKNLFLNPSSCDSELTPTSVGLKK